MIVMRSLITMITMIVLMMLPTLMMKCSEARILSDLIQHSPAQHFHHLRTDLQILIKMILIVLGEGSSVIDHKIEILHC